MAKKNVTVFKVESAGIDEFSKILLNPNFLFSNRVGFTENNRIKIC